MTLPFLRLVLAFLVVSVLSAAPPAWAQLQLPAPVGYINDFAGVIPEADQARINAVIDEVRGKSRGEIVVVTLQSLEGRTATEVALQIGREWQIGARGELGDSARNTGAVVLVVPSERQWRIETGLGTNTFITAAEAGRIGRDQMVPAFQEEDFGEGIYLGVTALARQYADEFGFELTGVAPQPEPSGGDGERGGPNLFTLLVVIFIIMLLFSGRRGGGGPRGGSGGGRRRGRRRGMPIIVPFPIGGGRGGFGGGFGGGGFGGGGFGGSGGGGGFGGGGAGGSW